MKLNETANQVSNLTIQGDLSQSISIKEGIINMLKKTLGYNKDAKLSQSKRDRWSKIRDESGGDINKIEELKGKLYTNKEKEESNYYESILLNKPYMTSKDKKNMKKVISNIKGDLQSPEDIEKGLMKLSKMVNYGSNYVEISGIKFSREKFIPQIEFEQEPDEQGIYHSDEVGIYKALYKGKEEYYMTPDQYIDHAKKQKKKTVKYKDIRKIIESLPSERKFLDDNREGSWSSIAYILGIETSGIIVLDNGNVFLDREKDDYNDVYGYIGTSSKIESGGYTDVRYRHLAFDKKRAALDRISARPPIAEPYLYIIN